MVIKYTNIYHSKAIQNLPKLGFLVWKQNIWQPWSIFQTFFPEETVHVVFLEKI
jgi:hypothetical protein